MVLAQTDSGKIEHSKNYKRFKLKFYKYEYDMDVVEFAYLLKSTRNIYLDCKEFNQAWYKKFFLRFRKYKKPSWLSKSEVIELWDLLTDTKSVIEMDYILKDRLKIK